MPASSAPTASESPAASASAAPPMAIARAPSSKLLAVEARGDRSIAWWAQRPTIRNATTNASAMAAVATISGPPTDSPVARAAATPRKSAMARSSKTRTPRTRSVSSSARRRRSKSAPRVMPLLEM